MLHIITLILESSNGGCSPWLLKRGSALSSSRFVLTSRSVSAKADCTQQYVGQLAIEGLVPHVVASNGTRLYTEEAASIVRKIKAERIARRFGSDRTA
jgi:hypothetical protein